MGNDMIIHSNEIRLIEVYIYQTYNKFELSFSIPTKSI